MLFETPFFIPPMRTLLLIESPVGAGKSSYVDNHESGKAGNCVIDY